MKSKRKSETRKRAMLDIGYDLRDRLIKLVGKSRRSIRTEAMIAIEEHLRRESSK